MRLISSNENKSEWPKRHNCENCGAELEYDEADMHIGWMGCEYLTCPNCDSEIMLSGERIMPPTWPQTFYPISAKLDAKYMSDEWIADEVKSMAKRLVDNVSPGEFALMSCGDTLIIGLKYTDNFDIYVMREYCSDSMDEEDYSIVK